VFCGGVTGDSGQKFRHSLLLIQKILFSRRQSR